MVVNLRQTALFADLPEADLQRLAQGCRIEHYDRGNILFHKGDLCHGFHLVLAGQVKLAFVSAAGNQKVVEIIRPGAPMVFERRGRRDWQMTGAVDALADAGAVPLGTVRDCADRFLALMEMLFSRSHIQFRLLTNRSWLAPLTIWLT